MTINIGPRPGVYSSFDASSVRYGSGHGVVGIIGSATKPAINTMHTFYSPAEARAVLGDTSTQVLGHREVELAFLNGAKVVHFAVVSNSSAIMFPNIKECFRMFESVDLDVIFCEVFIDSIGMDMREHILNCKALRRERTGVFCTFQSDILNHNMQNENIICIVTPLLKFEIGKTPAGNWYDERLLGAAFAGAIASIEDPSLPLTGLTVKGITYNPELHTEANFKQILDYGSSPMECPGGIPTLARAVTSRTKTDGVADNTWREVTTSRIINHVMKTLRGVLGLRFARAKNLPEVREAVRTQTIVELETMKTNGIIAGYGDVTVSQNDDDPTRCDIGLEFAVAHGMNTIVISANVII